MFSAFLKWIVTPQGRNIAIYGAIVLVVAVLVGRWTAGIWDKGWQSGTEQSLSVANKAEDSAQKIRREEIERQQATVVATLDELRRQRDALDASRLELSRQSDLARQASQLAIAAAARNVASIPADGLDTALRSAANLPPAAGPLLESEKRGVLSTLSEVPILHGEVSRLIEETTKIRDQLQASDVLHKKEVGLLEERVRLVETDRDLWKEKADRYETTVKQLTRKRGAGCWAKKILTLGIARCK